MSLLSDLKERNRDPVTDPAYYDAEMDAAIYELDHAGVYIMDVPKSMRDKALELDRQLTKAANEERREDFDMLLSEWRKCFH